MSGSSYAFTNTEKNRFKLIQLLQSPITKSEGNVSNLRSQLKLSLSKTLEEDIATLKQLYDQFNQAQDTWSSTKDADETEVERCFHTLQAHIEQQNTKHRLAWLKLSAELMFKNNQVQQKLEEIETKKEWIEPWLQLFILATSILDLMLGIMLFIAPHLTPLMAEIYLIISLISLICQVAMLGELITTNFSYRPLKNDQKILSESIHIINDAFNFSEQEKERELTLLSTRKKKTTPFSLFNTNTWFTQPEESNTHTSSPS
ncbi:MAG: hypothetical protein K0U37_00820 [Gammaproteobacteria bacterium]|nr:hypothetical protein [Gammaproteobacteria bacterium]